MSNNPDQIREDIERTRADLSTDVDALANKVNPSNVAHRTADDARGKITSVKERVKERVMGVAHDAEDKMHSVGDKMSSSGDSPSVGDRMHDTQRKAGQKAEGHPLAVGLMAFGAGLLISSFIPVSDKERHAAGQAKGQADSMKHDAASMAKQVGKDTLKSGAKDIATTAASAAKEVKDTATDAAKNVASEGASAAKDVKGSASESAQDVKETRR